MSPTGPIMHLGRPVEHGGEKEFPLANLPSGARLEHTRPMDWRPELAKDAAPNRAPGADGKPAAVTWTDLDDRGKAAYILAYKKATGNFPTLKVEPNPEYANADFEPNDWVEIISHKFGSVKDLRVFLDKYGWGHIHTSFMNGGAALEKKQQSTWLVIANLYMFVSSLERRGYGSSQDTWPFAIKGLSVPTEQHIKIAERVLDGEVVRTTAFTKHLMINARAGQKYGERGRIGYEARGGIEAEKERVVDSLLVGLEKGKWGKTPMAWGKGDFKLVSVGSTDLQVAALPEDFATLIKAHLGVSKMKGLRAQDVAKLQRFVADAKFFDRPQPARMMSFDQRACVPLLRYEKLPWLTDDEKTRVLEARGAFITEINELVKTTSGNTKLKMPVKPMSPTEAAQRISGAIMRWAQRARLGQVLGSWLDGDARVQHFR